MMIVAFVGFLPPEWAEWKNDVLTRYCPAASDASGHNVSGIDPIFAESLPARPSYKRIHPFTRRRLHRSAFLRENQRKTQMNPMRMKTILLNMRIKTWARERTQF